MEQRPLRLGDLVEDYCPRERRITDHAIVALVNNEIRQTRCSACESEHVYKEAKVPRRKKKAPVEALYDEVLADVAGGQLVTPSPTAEAPPADAPETAPPEVNGTDVPEAIAAAAEEEPADSTNGAEPPEEAGTHRQLIRATLPRVEGDEPPPRPIPEFTMHQRQGRSGQGRQGYGGNNQPRGGFRHGRGNADGNANGNSNSGGSGNSEGNQSDQGQPNGNRPKRGGKGRRRGSRRRSR